ncbi:hypothetical protein OAC89_05840 [Deltaproteobacteria bacterium]|nr:hypothetical protein [Deltaproteobacteria bacterium]
MEETTTEDRLSAEEDNDSIPDEQGREGGTQSEEATKAGPPQKSKRETVIRFAKRSDDEVMATISLLRNKAFFKREGDVKVIWNALGTISMTSDLSLNIEDTEYVSLGVFRESHMIVKHKEKVDNIPT